MKIFEFEPVPLSVTGSEAFTEASAEELRVLLALIERGYRENDESLARLAHVTKARCSAAVTFWQEAGVLQPRRADAENKITYAHPQKSENQLSDLDQFFDARLEEVAEEIRDKNLAELFRRCADMMGKEALSFMECKRLSELSSQCGLSADYLAILADDLNKKDKFNIPTLIRQAIKLSDNGITTTEQLVPYLADKEKISKELWEVRRILGIYDRNLSKTEEKLFLKWMQEFRFSSEIVGEAYDEAVVHTGNADIKYMDALLTKWHNEGYKTVAEIDAAREKYRAEKAANDERQAQKNAARPRKPAKEKPRYGNFDPEEAMRRAIERSFAELDETDDKSK